MKYSKDGRVSFEASTHTYLLGDKRLTGVTTLINKYKSKFDADAMAESFAKKHGLDKKALLKEWEVKGNQSLAYGTAVHKIFEDYILTGEYAIGGYHKESVARNFIDEIFEERKLLPVEAEMIIYNETVASQIDCIAMNSAGEYFILDWKTNSKIEKNGYRKFMYPPFQQYEDATFYHYSLQLSIYKKLCTEYKIKDAYIVHIDDDSYKFIKAENMHVPDYVISANVVQPASTYLRTPATIIENALKL